MKISIIGHNSCGKSTLAKKISQKYQIPHLELDRLWFVHGGNNFTRTHIKEREEVRKNIHRDVTTFLEKNNGWVSDGFYYKEQTAISNRADIVVLIDIPLWRRQLSHLKRILNRSERHPELTLWDEIYFTYDMIRRTRERKIQLNEFCQKYNDKIIRLTSHTEINQYLNSLIK